MTDFNEMVSKTVSIHEGLIKEYTSWLNIASITSTPYVVGLNGIYLTNVEIVDGKTTGKFDWTANPLRATRFSKENAEIVASVTYNGNNEYFKAIGTYDAVKSELKNSKKILAMYESAPNVA